MKRIIGLDPGESIGYAIGRVTDDFKTLVIEDHGWEKWQVFCKQLYLTQLKGEPFSYIVFEAWHLRKPKELYGSDMPSSQCIGQIKAAAYWVEPNPKVYKSPTAHKPVADGFMKKMGVELPKSSVEHNRDAIRHLVWYAVAKLGVTEIVYAR